MIDILDCTGSRLNYHHSKKHCTMHSQDVDLALRILYPEAECALFTIATTEKGATILHCNFSV